MAEEENEGNDGFDEICSPRFREDALFPQQRKRGQSVYSQRQSIKPLDIESIITAQKRISLNPVYVHNKCKNVTLQDKERLTKACHRPVTVPLAKIIGKVPSLVDVSELQGLRREVRLC